jgi:signal transduction histidine kinase
MDFDLNLKKFPPVVTLFFFLFNVLIPVPRAGADEFGLPKPGVMVRLSLPQDPPLLKGIKVYTDNPFRFDFILDRGDGTVGSPAQQPQDEWLKRESVKLIKYFLASLTIPEKDLWVNLSPYEQKRIIPDSFGLTEMGRDLLAEDYMLKQITASLIYPEDKTGRKFWQRVYEESARKYGTTNLPVNTYNKVWIVPEKAVIYENESAGTAYIVESSLRVMLEQDYLALEKHRALTARPPAAGGSAASVGANIVREIVIPELTREVNEGKNFAGLRQVYDSLILATWYKKKIKDSLINQVYSDRNKIDGININDPREKQKIYERYVQAYKKGAYNYIKEEMDPATRQTVPRKYFSGGLSFYGHMDLKEVSAISAPLLNPDKAMMVRADLAPRGKGDSAMASPDSQEQEVKSIIHEWRNAIHAVRVWLLPLTGAEVSPEQGSLYELSLLFKDLVNNYETARTSVRSREDFSGYFLKSQLIILQMQGKIRELAARGLPLERMELVERLQAALNGLRGFMEWPDNQMHLQMADLNRIINQSLPPVDTLGPPDKKVRIMTLLSPELPDAYVDPLKFGQVILNIVRNAQEAIEGAARGGTIVITTRLKDKDKIVIAVKDDGPGIEKEIQGQIFNPEHRTTKPYGSGLGLGIAKRIVDLQGGRISFQTTPGRGTTFFIELPVGPQSDQAMAADNNAEEQRAAEIFHEWHNEVMGVQLQLDTAPKTLVSPEMWKLKEALTKVYDVVKTLKRPGDFGHYFLETRKIALKMQSQIQELKDRGLSRLQMEQIKYLSLGLVGLLAYMERPIDDIRLNRADLNQLIKSLPLVDDRVLSGRRIKIIQRYSPHVPAVLVDSLRFGQVIKNIVKNAKEAIQGTGKEGTIEIITRTETDKRKILISIRDDGPGIEEEIQKQIFDPKHKTTKANGNGLGMGITKKMIEAQGGSLTFRTGRGQGTTFFIELPFADAAMSLKPQGPGGIDLTADRMGLRIQNTGRGIKFRIDPVMLRQLQDVPGFSPVIVNIQPISNLREFLGVK